MKPCRIRFAKGASAVVGLWLCFACADSAMDASAERCPRNLDTVRIDVSPAVLLRGEEVPVSVVWQLDMSVEAAVARLRVGDEVQVRAEVPLGLDESSEWYTYRGELLNPFGALAPTGEVEVLVEASVSGCPVGASAATSFELQ